MLRFATIIIMLSSLVSVKLAETLGKLLQGWKMQR
jgi:hypothetical protein